MTVTVGEIVQINFVVDDIDVAMKSWLATKQTGPFLVLRHVDDLPVTYRGRKTDLDISIAFAQLGSIHVELIQQHNDGPSVYRDVFGPSQGGFHHICTPVEDFEAARQGYLDDGFEIGMDLEFGGTPVAYVDTFAPWDA